MFSFLVGLSGLISIHGDLSYSVQEEMKSGSVIGSIAKDLGLTLDILSARKARIESEENEQRYCEVNLRSGELIVSERQRGTMRTNTFVCS